MHLFIIAAIIHCCNHNIWGNKMELKRLLERLENGVGVTVVSGPAASGKSTLVIAAASQNPENPAMMQVDVRDLKFKFYGCGTCVLESYVSHWNDKVIVINEDDVTGGLERITYLRENFKKALVMQSIKAFVMFHAPANIHLRHVIIVTRIACEENVDTIVLPAQI